MSPELLAVIVAIFLAVADTRAFLSAALSGRPAGALSTWGFAAALLVMLTALHTLLMALVLSRWLVRPLLSLLITLAAIASYYVQKFGVYLDPTMVRNVVHTDFAEARELLSRWTKLPST